MSRNPANLAHSVHQRLLNLATARGEDPNVVFIQYGLERLLYRIGRSKHRDHFVLKGAMLFVLWKGQFHRTTRDLDLLGTGDASDETLINTFGEIALTEVEPDGLTFEHQEISISEIREVQEYPGKRLKFPVRLGNTRLTLQIDIGFGDVVTPNPKEVKYPTLLDLPAPSIRAYPIETVVAEKLQAMVALDMVTSRMKDFYDLWALSRSFAFAGPTLARAIKATFTRRDTAIPPVAPGPLTQAFAEEPGKATQWRAFLKRNRFDQPGQPLSQIIEDLREFLLEPLHVAATDRDLSKTWKPGGPWTPDRA